MLFSPLHEAISKGFPCQAITITSMIFVGRHPSGAIISESNRKGVSLTQSSPVRRSRRGGGNVKVFYSYHVTWN